MRFLGRLGRELARLDEAPAATQSHAQATPDTVRDTATLGREQAQAATRPQTALVLNKVDAVRDKSQLLGTSRRLHDAFAFDWPPFMLSA